MKSHKKTLKFIIGCALSIFFLFLAFRNVEFRRLAQVFRTINYWWIIPFILITLLSMYMRSIRWRWILKSRYNFSSVRLFPSLVIGFALNSLLPLRAGEFARPFVLARKEKIPYSTLFATVFVERIIDSMTLLFSFLVVLLFVKINPEISVPLEMGKWKYTISGHMLENAGRDFTIMIAILFVFSFSLLLNPTRRIYEGVIRRLPFFRESFKNKLIELLRHFSEGFHSLRNVKYLAMIALYSLIIWALIGFSLQVMSWGFPGLPLNFFHGMAVTIIICFAILLPAAPGYWGLYECGTIFALLTLGFISPKDGYETALGFSLMIHSMQTIPIILLGIFFLWKENLSLRQIEKLEEECKVQETV